MNVARPALVEALARQVESLEEIPVGPAGWSAGFLSIVAVRHFLEIRSSQYPLYPPSAFYVHYVLAYLAPLLTLALILSWFSAVRLERVLRLMLLAWGLTLLPPLIDALMARAHEARIGYLELGTTPSTRILLRFFDPTHALQGTTPGIRIEAAMACLLGAVYAWMRAPSHRVLRALATAAGVYVSSLFFFTLPSQFERAVRLVLPDVTRTLLFVGIGRVSRPSIETVRADQAILLYLIPLALLLGALALARTNAPLLRRIAFRLASSEGPGWAIICALGAAGGWAILDGVPQSTPSVPFDGLARLAGCLALGLAGGGLALLVPEREAQAGAGNADRTAGAVILAAGALLGAAASIDLAAFLTIAVGAGFLSRAIPKVLPWAFLAPQAAAGVAIVSAFLSGFALAAGADALVLFPSALLLAMFLAGFLADLAQALGPHGRPVPPLLRAGAAAGPILAAAVPALALHARPTTSTVATGVLFSAATVAVSVLIPGRLVGILSLAGVAATLGLSIADPAQTGAWRERALAAPIYFIRLSQKAEAEGDLKAAAGAAHEAIRRAPGLAAPHHRLALVRMKSSDVAGGLEEFRIAAELDQKDAPLQGNMASALLQAGKPSEALPFYDRALSLDPDLLSTRFNRARCLDAAGRRAEADAAWREYMSKASSNPEEAASVEIARQRLATPRPQ